MHAPARIIRRAQLPARRSAEGVTPCRLYLVVTGDSIGTVVPIPEWSSTPGQDPDDGLDRVIAVIDA